jgi:prolyl-tRNA synthetase
MCTLTMLSLHWLTTIQQDRKVYLNIATVKQANVYKKGTVYVYLPMLQSLLLMYMEQDRYEYFNSATVTLVNVYRTGPVCVT